MQEPETTLHLTAVVTPDDDWFMARCVEVPVVSQGPTVDEAIANLTEALELYFEDEPAPTPSHRPPDQHPHPGVTRVPVPEALPGISVDELRDLL